MFSQSPNFGYLSYFGAPLVEAAARAEGVISLDPVGALVHLRRFGELLARSTAARMGVDERGNDEQVERLRRLEQRGLSDTVLRMFHSLRQLGNRAAHDGIGTQQDAFTQL